MRDVVAKRVLPRVLVYSLLILAAVATATLVLFRTAQITGKEAAGYMDGALQDLYGVTERARENSRRGRSILRELVIIKAKARQVAKLDRKVRIDLQETEEKLRRLDAAEEILGRHHDFVTEYTRNETELERISGALTSSYLRSLFHRGSRLTVSMKLDSLRGFLKEVEPPEVDPPLDPEKLPHRMVRANGLRSVSYVETPWLELGSRKGPPSDSELMETVEVQITSEIGNLASRFNKSAVGIYEYVKNNFEFEPYYGSLKGAERTLLEGAGNDFDLSSLLVALLRASGIPSRYVYGEVTVLMADLTAWLGDVESRTTACDIVAANGIPARLLIRDDDTVGVTMEHCWVEVCLGGDQGAWVQLDPSYKMFSRRTGLDISRSVAFDEQGYLKYLTTHRRRGYLFGRIRLMPSDEKDIPSPLDFYLQQVREYLEIHYPDSSLLSTVSNVEVIPERVLRLPDALPYRCENVLSVFPEIPEAYRHRVRFEVSDLDGKMGLSHEVSTPELALKPVLLFYSPAAEEDEALVKAYGESYEVPAYLLKMRPHLRIGGRIVASGKLVGFGDSQIFEIGFCSPGDDEAERIGIEAVAGAFYAPCFDLQRTPEDFAERYMREVDRSTGSRSTLSEEEQVEMYLNGLGIWYLSQLDGCDGLLREMLQMVNCRETSQAMLGLDEVVTYVFGVPYDLDVSGVSMDTHRLVNKPFSVSGDRARQQMYNLISGYESSYLMQYVMEYWRGSSSVSAVEILQVANQRKIPVHAVNSENRERIGALLLVSEKMKQRIRRAVEAGKTVIIPERELTIGRWRGTGYIVTDPVTRDGAYKIRKEREAPATSFGTISLGLFYLLVLCVALTYALATVLCRRRGQVRTSLRHSRN